MKTAIYIEDGVVQLVLTPQDEFERNALRSFENKPMSVSIKTGAFYDCQGGWTRQTDTTFYGATSRSEDRSLILRVTEDKAAA